jgi:hypothetical protein
MTSDAMNIDADLSDDDLSRAVGTETLLARDLVPGPLPTSSKLPAEQQVLPYWGDKVLGSRSKRQSPPQLQGV